MAAAPPKAMEAVVGFLIPPACREHVLGDLHERYRNRRQYLADAACTVPWVIASRIRRTTDPQVLLMEAFAIYLAFLGAAWMLEGTAFLNREWSLLRLAIPAAVALMALVLGDAYAHPGKRSPLRPFLEATMGVGLAVLSQAAIWTADHDWVLPRWIMISGGGTSVLLVATLRLLFPPDSQRPRGAT